MLPEQQNAYYEAFKEAVNVHARAYYQTNKDAIRKKRKAYLKANPHIMYTAMAKRRAKKLQASPPWANKEHIDSIYYLASINRKAGYDVQVDHIVPLQSKLVCGLHCESNLQLLQGSDNMTKGNRRWPDQW
jgi:hypothetical protein